MWSTLNIFILSNGTISLPTVRMPKILQRSNAMLSHSHHHHHQQQQLSTNSPWAVTLSWQHVTYKPSKLGHADLVFSLWSECIRRSVLAGFQESLRVQRLWFAPAWLHTHRQLLSGYTPCPKKTKQICFCQNFVKFPQISIIFGRKMGNDPNICEVHLICVTTLPC